MPSPFPGMDPYLEDPTLWPDLHQSLITYMRDMLQQLVRPRYLARIGERVYVVEDEHHYYPDVTLIQRPVRESATPVATEAPPVAAPVREPLVYIVPPGEYREPFIEIVHASGAQVVTVIEVLSPANKAPGQGHRRYRQKQRDVLRSRAHLVEIDLLSQGLFALACGKKETWPVDLVHSRYLLCVSRAPDRTRFETYPLILPEPLPLFRIPLNAPDPDVTLDLQAVFNRCYENGRYADFVDYGQPPKAPLSLDEQHWLKTYFKRETA